MPGQVQYMPVQTNAAPVYQAQVSHNLSVYRYRCCSLGNHISVTSRACNFTSLSHSSCCKSSIRSCMLSHVVLDGQLLFMITSDSSICCVGSVIKQEYVNHYTDVLGVMVYIFLPTHQL